MRTLEAKLGVRLLDRSTRSVGATELGRQFLEGVAGARGAGTGSGGHRRGTRQAGGLLRLNVARVSAELLLYPHFGDFAAAYPDIVLELVCDNRMVDLVEGGFDAGIRLGESLAQDAVALPIAGRSAW